MNNTFLAIDIGSSNITAVIAKHDLENNINILGTGIQKSGGINKGLIINIEEASKSIKDAVSIAKRTTTELIDTTVVSISGSYSKSIRSSGSVNVPNGLITETEINQVMQMALYNATIVPEYEVVHVVPIFFKVDDSVEVDNPLNMNGSRLEVSVYIVTAKRTALTNIKSALKTSGIEVVKFVLDSYASALAVLDDQQKKFGAVVINLGSTTTEFVYFKGNSIIFNGFIPVGSNHITNDLSVMLHTPPTAAEKIKLEYGSLLRNYSPNNELGVTKVKIPRIGDEESMMKYIIPEDLLKFGLIPEFIGRLPVMAALDKLTENDLVRILTEPKNALVKQYKKLLELDETTLEFEEKALHAIAAKAIERNTGARGLRSIIEDIMMDVMFEIPSQEEVQKVVITEAAAKEEGQPEIFYKEKKVG